jgi:hypothetical protein
MLQPGRADPLRIIVLGYIVRGPIGGLAWHHLQYVMGLSLMGHEVVFVEDSGDTEWSCYDPSTGETGINPDYGLQFAQQAFSQVGLPDQWCYHDTFTSRWLGPFSGKIEAYCRDADLLLNLSGVNVLRGALAEVPTRAYVDTDPAFTQIRNLQDKSRRDFVGQHNTFFSFGENIGTKGCNVPNDGFPWQPTRQPVVLDKWPVVPARKNGRFTTVMQWDSYKVREYGGVSYGMKSRSFEPYMDLPEKTGSTLELAIGSESAPRELLQGRGWHLRDPLEVTRDLWTYQRYLQQSMAEFSIAKHGYVITNSGWFSERSANYLASGRPVLVQDTGFSDWLSTGSGVIAFNNPGEALAGIERISRKYGEHCEAARAVAEEYFDSYKVLTSLVERAMQVQA